MEKIDWQNRFLAFKGDKLIADGKQLEVALKLKAEGAEPALRRGEILLFAGADGRQWHAVRHWHRACYCGSRGDHPRRHPVDEAWLH